MMSTGLVRATVIENKDPDKLGRIRVSFPSLGAQGKGLKSEWCRVARPTGYGDAGDWFLPEIGSEVVVGFESGEIGFPIVLGCVLGKDASAVKSGRSGDANENGENNLRVIRTRSGHTLVFDDLSGKEAVILKDKASNELALLSAEKKVVLRDCHGNVVELQEDGIHIQAKSGDKLILDQGGIKILSATKIELGEGASKSVVLGEDLLQAFNSHTHIYAATMSMGTTNPPMTPMNPSVLSKKVKVS